MTPVFLVLNSGSSSLKFQVFEAEGSDEPRRMLRGQFQGLGHKARFTVTNAQGEVVGHSSWQEGDEILHEQALNYLASWLREHSQGLALAGVGHRVVHGGTAYSKPVRIEEGTIEALERLVPLAPLHQPHNLEPIRILRQRFPQVAQ